MIGRWNAIASAAAIALPLGIADGGPPPRLRQIEQTIDDADELAVSLRVLGTDLRDPSGWSQLFEDTQNPGSYVRINGAICAVSPTTRYGYTKKIGIYPQVSPGTIFYIGGMPEAPPAPKRDPISPRGESRPCAVRMSHIDRAVDVMLARVAAPNAVRATEAERERAVVLREFARDRAADSADASTDLGEGDARTRRILEISLRVLNDG